MNQHPVFYRKESVQKTEAITFCIIIVIKESLSSQKFIVQTDVS